MPPPKLHTLEALKAQFFSRIDRQPGLGSTGECWIWTAGKSKAGYGMFNWHYRRQLYAHRIAWFFEHGEWPIQHICHSCDTPACVRPSHLWQGSPKENLADMISKGRHLNGLATRSRANVARGNQLPQTKLNPDAVIAIREAFATNQYTKADLARTYGVSRATIRLCVNRVNWKHIE